MIRELCATALLLLACGLHAQRDFQVETVAALRNDIISTADWAMEQLPITITSYLSSRSAGGKHDFFSEADYWWPDPANPDGPYVQRDGETNPDNFVEHRRAMIRFSQVVGALASAYLITRDEKYLPQIAAHLKAWFIDPVTRMNPSLLYAQAIKGRVTGRGIGIIDTIHLMEVALGILVIEQVPGVDRSVIEGSKQWFAEYLEWLTTHQYGKDEMNATNNHATCWVMQVGVFARLTGNKQLLDLCRDRYQRILLPGQMASDGSFPRELARTKPYGYSLLNIDAMAAICLILSDSENNLWHFKLEDGQGIRKGIEYLYPYVKEKDSWPHKKDVMYWNEWPVAQPFLLFGATAFNHPEWFNTWLSLKHRLTVEEVVRNMPVRNPVLWLAVTRP